MEREPGEHRADARSAKVRGAYQGTTVGIRVVHMATVSCQGYIRGANVRLSESRGSMAALCSRGQGNREICIVRSQTAIFL
jgi:hypothetical protein